MSGRNSLKGFRDWLKENPSRKQRKKRVFVRTKPKSPAIEMEAMSRFAWEMPEVRGRRERTLQPAEKVILEKIKQGERRAKI